MFLSPFKAAVVCTGGFPKYNSPPTTAKGIGNHSGQDFVVVPGSYEENWNLYAIEPNGIIRIDEVNTNHSAYGKTVVYSFSTYLDDDPHMTIHTFSVRYAHLKTIDSKIVAGRDFDMTNEQLYIGVAGNTGNVLTNQTGKNAGRHLHIELRIDNVLVKPSSYIDFKFVSGSTSKTATDSRGQLIQNPYPFLSYDECNTENKLFKTENGTFVHIIKQQEIRTDNLTDYYIVVSTFDPYYFTQEIVSLVEKALNSLPEE